MRLAALLAGLGVLICCGGAKQSKEGVREGFDSLTVTLEHAVGANGQFEERGVASVRSLKSSVMAMALTQNPLTHAQLEDIKKAAQEGGVYRLRAQSQLREGPSEATGDEKYVSTFISACSLVRAGLSDIIKITGDGRGNIIGLAVTTPSISHSTDCTSLDVTLPRAFNTSIELDNGSPPPMPNVQSFLQKQEKEEREKREGKDNRSFFQKYWMYILVGVFLVMMLNGGASAAGGGGGGGGGG